MQKHQNYNNRGISIVELLVAIMIIGMTITALISFSTFSLRIASLFEQTTQASFLAQDYMEALKNYRDNTGWNDDDPGDQYDGLGRVASEVSLHLELSGDTPPRWQLLLNQETFGIFTRVLVIEPVERNAIDDIVESGGTVDSETKKATVTVSWEERGETREFEITTYLTNFR